MKNYGTTFYQYAKQLQPFTNQDFLVLNCGFYSASNSSFLQRAQEEHALIIYLHKGNATVTFNEKKTSFNRWLRFYIATKNTFSYLLSRRRN